MSRAEYFRSDESSMKTLLSRFLRELLAAAEIARTVRYQCCAITICVLIYGCLQLSRALLPFPSLPQLTRLRSNWGSVYSAILGYLTTIRAVANRATIFARMARA